MNKAHHFLLLLLTSSLIFPAAQYSKVNQREPLNALLSAEEIELVSEKIKASILEAINKLIVYDAHLDDSKAFFTHQTGLYYDQSVRFTLASANAVTTMIYNIFPGKNKEIIANTAFDLAKQKIMIEKFPMKDHVAENFQKRHNAFEQKLLNNIKTALSLSSKPELKPRNRWRFLY